MHSLLGSATFDLALVLLLVYLAVPPLLRHLDRKVQDKRFFRFAGKDLRGHRTTFAVAAGSALAGTVSHVLLDPLHHPYNPLTFPFSEHYGFNYVPFGALELAGLVVQATALLFLLSMLYFWYARQFFERPREVPT